MKKLAILHTTSITIPSMKELIRERTDQVEVINLLDDSMLPEINRAGKMTEEVGERIRLMIRLAKKAGADAFLSACSSIGGVVEEAGAHTSFAVYRIDMPMARQAAGYEKIGVAATLRSTIEPTTELIERLAHQAGRSPEVESVVIEGAGDLLNEGKTEEYDRMVQATLKKLAEKNDIVVLAQASMARAVAGLPKEERTKCLTSPVSGIEEVLSEMCGECGWKKKRSCLEGMRDGEGKRAIGLDIGTTHIKACLTDESGKVLAVSETDNEQKETAGFGKCFLSEELFDKAVSCIRQVAKNGVCAIGITSMAEAGVFLDESGRPLMPVIPWSGDGGACLLPEGLRKEALYNRTGLIWHPKYTVNRILDLRKERPELYREIRCFLSVSDYILYRLTGTMATDESLACRTGMYDIWHREYWKEMLEFSGMEGKLP